jgi:aminoglycoside 6'-N-acetyltransferase Ib
MQIFSFKRLSEGDIPKLYEWLNRPHVRRIWDERFPDVNSVRKKYEPHMNSENIFGYMASLNGEQVGYVQAYGATEMGDGFESVSGRWGIDQFLACEDDLGKGLGTAMVTQFCKFILERHGAKIIVTDPDPENLRAIRCYEKVGFKKVSSSAQVSHRAYWMEMTMS